MKKAKHDELRSECSREDLGKGVRGKYLKAYRAGTDLVLLKPEDEGTGTRLVDTKLGGYKKGYEAYPIPRTHG